MYLSARTRTRALIFLGLEARPDPLGPFLSGCPQRESGQCPPGLESRFFLIGVYTQTHALEKKGRYPSSLSAMTYGNDSPSIQIIIPLSKSMHLCRSSLLEIMLPLTRDRCLRFVPRNLAQNAAFIRFLPCKPATLRPKMIPINDYYLYALKCTRKYHLEACKIDAFEPKNVGFQN